MRRPHKILAAIVVICVLALFAICLFWGCSNKPKLSVTYIQTINGNGQWRLQFGITNIGNCRIFTSRLGEFEVLNHTSRISATATSPLSSLEPRQGQVVDAVLSEAKMDFLDQKWRYTCLYGGDGLRARIYTWQWGPAGPGPRVNWLVPKPLKGMRLDVKGTSEWIASR